MKVYSQRMSPKVHMVDNFGTADIEQITMNLRNEMKKVSPDIELQQEIEIEGETVMVDIPMTVNFFWPQS